MQAAVRYADVTTDRDGVPWDLGAPIRLAAVRALADFYGGPVEEGLTQALADADPAVRRAAVDGLGAQGVPVGTDRLIECVVRWSGPEDEETAARAVEVLESWGIEGLPEKLVDELLQPDAPELEARHANVLDRLLAGDPRGRLAAGSVADLLIDLLAQTTDPDHLARAEEILGWLGPAAGDALLASFVDESVTPPVVRAVAHLNDARAVEPVIRLLNDPDPAMREASAVALKGLNDTRAVPALVSASQDSHQSVRDAASAALDSMGMAAVIVGLGTLMASREGGAQQELPAEALEALEAHADASEPAGWVQGIVDRHDDFDAEE